jgi:hypothetical protein
MIGISGVSNVGGHLFGVLELVAVGAQPAAARRPDVLQRHPVAHQQAGPAEAALGAAAPPALRLACSHVHQGLMACMRHCAPFRLLTQQLACWLLTAHSSAVVHLPTTDHVHWATSTVTDDCEQSKHHGTPVNTGIYQQIARSRRTNAVGIGVAVGAARAALFTAQLLLQHGTQDGCSPWHAPGTLRLQAQHATTRSMSDLRTDMTLILAAESASWDASAVPSRTCRQKWQQMPAAESYIDPRAWLLQRCAASAAVSGRSGIATGGAPPPLLGPFAGLLPLPATSFPDAAADALPAKPWAVDVKNLHPVMLSSPRSIISRQHTVAHAETIQMCRSRRTFDGGALLG